MLEMKTRFSITKSLDNGKLDKSPNNPLFIIDLVLLAINSIKSSSIYVSTQDGKPQRLILSWQSSI